MKKLFKIIALFIITISSTNSFGFNRQTSLIETDKLEPITIETIGKGKPILFLPGFTAPESIWKETIQNLTLERESHLVSYAGFNGNKPIEMPWYSNIKNALVEYIKENNMNNIIIVGHSMGGNLAVDIAAELNNKVSKIIIVEALPCMREIMMPNVPAENFYYSSPYNTQMLNMDKAQFQGMATMMASNMTLKEDKKEIIKDWILKADRKTWVYGYTDLLKLDLRTVLNKIKCETLIIGASFPDVVVAKQNYEDQYTNLTNKTIIMASNSKHFLMFDQPEWFYKTVNDFLVNEK